LKKPNKIAIFIIFAMFGFILASFIVTFKDGYSYTPYGEIIIINKKIIVERLLTKRIDTLLLLAKEFSMRGTTFSKDSEKERVNNMKKIQNLISISRRDFYLTKFGNADTSLTFFARYIGIQRQTFLNAINSFKWKDDTVTVNTIHCQIIDTCKLLNNGPITFSDDLKLRQNKRDKIMDFLTDYPIFGFWIVFTIAQMSFWFLLYPLLYGNLYNLKGRLGEYFDISAKKIAVNAVLPIIVTLIVCVVFYFLLADTRVINDAYFLTHYNAKIYIYGIPGYIAIIFCFSSYLTLADQVDSMNDKANELKLNRTDDGALDSKYLILKAAFDMSFFCSGLILSFFVLWAGITANAINVTEIAEFYENLAGKPLIPNDFIYLMGLFHTCILLIFYLPVKLKFDNLSITQSPGPENDKKNSRSNAFYKNLTDNLGTFLVTTSPLLAGFVHTLLNLISK